MLVEKPSTAEFTATLLTVVRKTYDSGVTDMRLRTVRKRLFRRLEVMDRQIRGCFVPRDFT